MGMQICATVATCAVFLIFFSSFAEAQTQLQNPLNASFSNIPSFIAGALKVVVMVALPLLALAFVYSGYLFVMAQGNSTDLENAKRNFMYTVIGAILILGAWVIATLIGGTVSQLVG